MKLSDRQTKLLKLMAGQKRFRQINYYSELLNVTERTIQNDLDNINLLDFTNTLNIKRKPNVGIFLDNRKTEVEEFLSLNFNKRLDIDSLERRAKIVQILAIDKKVVTYLSLSELLYCSTTVIINEIKSLKYMNVKNAKIVSDNLGTRLEASEYYTQKFLKVFFLEYIELKELDLNRNLRKNNLKKYFSDDIVDSIFEITEEIEDVINYKITDYYLISIEIILLVLSERIRRNFHFDRDVNDLSEDYFDTLTNYPFALEVSNKIYEKLGIELNEEEVRYVSYQMFLHKIEVNINNKYMESTFESDVKKIIEYVSFDMGCNLIRDKRLYNSLIFHIVPLFFRTKSNVKIKNPLYKEVVNADTKLFYSICLAVKTFEEKYNLTLSNDEISFLSIHFQVALARLNMKQKAYVVCETGMVTSELLTSKLMQNLPSSLEIVPLSKKQLYDLEEIDANFIISTVTLDSSYEPYIKINSLMDDEDMKNVYSYYLKYGNHKYFKKSEELIFKDDTKLIDENLIFTKMKFNTKYELFKHAESILLNDGIITNEFLNSVLEREEAGSTLIAENVALPHSDPKFAQKTKLLIYTLREPLQWEYKNKVDVVFLLVLSESDANNYLDRLLSLHEFISDYQNIVKLSNMSVSEISKVMEIMK